MIRVLNEKKFLARFGRPLKTVKLQTITTLSNERALGSIYYYKIETLGSSLGYMRVLKLETLHKDKFYKLEVSSKLYDSPQMAEKAFDQGWPVFETAIKSFVFLPY